MNKPKTTRVEGVGEVLQIFPSQINITGTKRQRTIKWDAIGSIGYNSLTHTITFIVGNMAVSFHSADAPKMKAVHAILASRLGEPYIYEPDEQRS